MYQDMFKKVLSGFVIGGLVMSLGLGCKKKEEAQEPPAGTEQPAPTAPEGMPGEEPQAPYGMETPSMEPEAPTMDTDQPLSQEDVEDETQQDPML